MSRARILGLDYGSRTVGVAVTDPTGIVVREVEIIRRTNETQLRKTLRRIENLAKELDVSAIVLGLPLNMDGTRGERAVKTEAFGEILQRRTGLPVLYQDERLTTVEAEEIMESRGIRKEDYANYVDMIAAAVILGDYLNQHEERTGADQ